MPTSLLLAARRVTPWRAIRALLRLARELRTVRSGVGTARTEGSSPTGMAGVPADSVAEPASAADEVPPDLSHLPEPPVLQAAPGQGLERHEIFRMLREFELDVPAFAQIDPPPESIVAAALAAIGDPAAQRRYFPRRPNLLPELMRAMNDDGVSVRYMVGLVARDPALVGSLLRMANSSYYRVTPRPVETIERALVVLGTDGLRSVMAAALMQPIFQVGGTGTAARFPEFVWEHALRSAHAAIPHAALVERTNGFAAELLCLTTGLAEIVLFRAAIEHFAAAGEGEAPDPLVIASLLQTQSAAFAWQIGADWRLSEEVLAALEEQMATSTPATPLGRSLGFGRHAGALAVLHGNSRIDEATLKLSLPAAGLSPAHLRSMLSRLLRPQEDPRSKDPKTAQTKPQQTLLRLSA